MLNKKNHKEIEEEILKDKNKKVLNLKNRNLEELPNSIGELSELTSLDLSQNRLTSLPNEIGNLKNLTDLTLTNNKLSEVNDGLSKLDGLKTLNIGNNRITSIENLEGKFPNLIWLNIGGNQLTEIPSWIKNWDLRGLALIQSNLDHIPNWIFDIRHLEYLFLSSNEIKEISNDIWKLQNLRALHLHNNQIKDLPSTIPFQSLSIMDLSNNPLSPELKAVQEQGLDAVKAYLKAKDQGEITLNEAKLILIGEGGVGKTSLLASLSGKKWVDKRETTHGVEVDIQSLTLNNPNDNSDIKLNGWDFGGQSIYRHTHQLFFTAPAIYLAVWEPRRGPDQSRVQEWIKMVKQRAFDENLPKERPRILVVATHGGPTERLAHIDEQAIRDEFGDLIVGFHHVDSKPNTEGICFQLNELKVAIGQQAADIPSVGRKVPSSWKKVLDAIRERSIVDPYISFLDFETICEEQGVLQELVPTYAIIMNELGHLIYYPKDEALKDAIILNPEYLSKAVGFVLEDQPTKASYGLIEHDRLSEIWNNPVKEERDRYPESLYPVFLRLMDRFDLSYKVNRPNGPDTSLMAQLVPNKRPEGWEADWTITDGDFEKSQVCRVLDATTGRTTEAEGLMYRLIVRLHRYSLGKDNYNASKHWKKGIILDDGYNGRGFIEEIDGDLHVTVRAAYPELFLHQLCNEIQWLVEDFWKGLDARLFVPCITPKCKGLLEFEEITEYKKNGIPKIRCSVCKTFHDVDELITARDTKPKTEEALIKLQEGQERILAGQEKGFATLETQLKVLMSQVDEQYQALMTTLTNEAKEGPRLFSLEPVDRSNWNPKQWGTEKYRLVLWCEHSKKPLTAYEEGLGTYEIEIPKEWMQKAVPLIRVVSKTLSLALPIVAPGVKLGMDDPGYKGIGEQLEFAVKASDSLLKGGKEIGDWLTSDDPTSVNETQEVIRAQGSLLRELHSMLKQVDPNNSYGGLVRVQNKKREFLWVHEQFVQEY